MTTQETQFQTRCGVVRAVFRPGTNDWNTLQSCLVEDEYVVMGVQPHNRSGIDVGAHIGGFTMALLANGYDYVRAVEPLPENLELLRYNLSLNGWTDKVEVIEGGVGAGKVTKVAYNAPDDVHRYVGYPAAEGEDGVDVPVTPINRLVAAPRGHVGLSWRWDILKLDCEGAEWPLLEAKTAKADILSVDRIVAELHDHGAQASAVFDRFEAAIPANFKRFSADGGQSLVHVDYRQ